MKSFTKVGLLFALIIVGRYLQPVAAVTVAAHPTPAVRTLPLALARYINPPRVEDDQPASVSPQQPTGYFL